MQEEAGVSPPLADIRGRMDEVDRRLLEALIARFRLASEVGSMKAGLGVQAWDPRREADIVRRASVFAREEGVPEEGVRDVFWTVLGYCREAVARAGTTAGAPPSQARSGT